MPDASLYIGLDAGGSKTDLCASSGRGGVFRRSGPAANALRQGVEATAHVLATLVQDARAERPGLPLRALCAGVAGAGLATDREALAEHLRRLLGPAAPAHLLIVTDAAIALEGAFEGGSGLILIAGTGSVAFARTTDGAMHRAGGWGFRLGDEGSGYALGEAGLRAVAHAFDGGPPTHLQQLLADKLGLATPADLLRRVYHEAWPLQEAAPLVLTAAASGDAVAQALVLRQAQQLAQLVSWLAARVAASVEPRLALLGGLRRDAHYAQALTAALHDALPGWTLQEPLHPPAMGALRLALAAS